jgi:hypothetical protein
MINAAQSRQFPQVGHCTCLRSIECLFATRAAAKTRGLVGEVHRRDLECRPRGRNDDTETFRHPFRGAQSRAPRSACIYSAPSTPRMLEVWRVAGLHAESDAVNDRSSPKGYTVGPLLQSEMRAPLVVALHLTRPQRPMTSLKRALISPLMPWSMR